jgi:hypothetical protein
MPYEVVCRCGNVLPVSAGMAGTALPCDYGQSVNVPSLSQLEDPAQARSESQAPEFWKPADSPPISRHVRIESTPIQVSLRTTRGPSRDRRAAVMVLASRDAVWIQDVWHSRSIPLGRLKIEDAKIGEERTLVVEPESDSERLNLRFASAHEAERWCE